MAIDYVFAGLAVSDLETAIAWYERFFGRPPTFLPNEIEAVWQLAATASLYVVVDATRAGRGIVTLAVDHDLGAYVAEVAARGIVCGSIQGIPGGAGWKSVVGDPDGNTIALVQVLARG